MRKIAKGVAVLALVCSSAAYAQSQSGAYWGGTVGLMDVDLPGVDNPVNLGIRGGYTLPSGWGFEAEFTNSVISGEAGVFDDEDMDIMTLAGYGTYRSYGDIYFKGRLGLLFEDVEVGNFSDDDTGISLGGGVGINFSPNLNFELEYTLIENDIAFWSGSAVMRF